MLLFRVNDFTHNKFESGNNTNNDMTIFVSQVRVMVCEPIFVLMLQVIPKFYSKQGILIHEQENVVPQAVKNGLPLSTFPFLNSLPQITNLVVCV